MNRLAAAIALAAAALFACCLNACGDGASAASQDRFAAGDRAAIPAALRQPTADSRAVDLPPAGTWEVREPPQRYIAYQAIDAEIALALGRAEGLVALFDRDTLATLDRLFYAQLPGVRAQLDGVRDLPFGDRVDQELFLAMQADAVLIDPRLPIAFWGWSPQDLQRVSARLAPFVGNFIRYPRDTSWGPTYPQPDLATYSATLARLFHRSEHWQGVETFRQRSIDAIRAELPDQRPRICVINIGSDPAAGTFYLVDLAGGGARSAHFASLGIEQAWRPDGVVTGAHGACDYETLAAIDPPVIIVQWALTQCADAAEFERRFVEPMRQHPLGSRLRAVREDRVLPGGTGEQGPITHLFQVEMLAQQLFPERFGTWRWGDAPERPLFDRGALARLIRGAQP